MSNTPGIVPQQILADRPAVGPDGVLAPWLGQLLQLLLNYIGSPDTGGGGAGGSVGGTSLTEQINSLIQSVSTISGAGGADGPTQARLMALERLPTPLAPVPPPAAVQRPPPFDLTGAPSNFLDQAFGSVWGNILFRGQYTWQVLAPGSRPNLVLRTSGAGGNPFWGNVRPDTPGVLGTRRGGSATQAYLGDGRGNILGEGP